jgi:hypothetical protein
MFVSEVIHDRRRLEIEVEPPLREALRTWGADLVRFEIVDIGRG